MFIQNLTNRDSSHEHTAPGRYGDGRRRDAHIEPIQPAPLPFHGG